MGSNLKIRIILDAAIVLSIAIFPWWLTFFLIALGLLIFSKFYEAFLFGFILDSLYFVPREIFWNIPFISFLIVIISFLLINWIKRRLRLYDN